MVAPIDNRIIYNHSLRAIEKNTIMKTNNQIIQIFIPMEHVPTVTYQQKKVTTINGKVTFYEPPKLKEVRQMLFDGLYPHRPSEPLSGPVRLMSVWLYDTKDKKKLDTWKTTKPDTDNLVKLLKDVMTDCGYWHDDAQVCKEEIQKVWSEPSGLYIEVERL